MGIPQEDMGALREEGRTEMRRGVTFLGMLLLLACVYSACITYIVASKVHRIVELQDEKVWTLAGMARVERVTESIIKLTDPRMSRVEQTLSLSPSERLENLHKELEFLHGRVESIIDKLCWNSGQWDTHCRMRHECPKHQALSAREHFHPSPLLPPPPRPTPEQRQGKHEKHEKVELYLPRHGAKD
ncbi:MAG: hypothetical protein COV10_03275 [Candidatus Vogelbacteria bacterium CG10_big_fil_rev_8_21_14_0_10_51_16]|uniref:Uncharacterized protein n=1 Tax=Candidatus Vogelbacteria bacterium CG10_big_fil_rev_8_21_14_0_10_51_16 TaxID=1975045 RepID=A0A2H0RDU3_9BACT|nr:MAG: hypothetical protein COV10_03275 [Candidatus Vogelbacteria bacterium CG10_big_fil_rev_8_21_14_0_10_51_16]